MNSIYIERLLHNCVQYADKTAIVDQDGQRSTTYGEMLLLARKVEKYLKAELQQKHSFVCIRLDDSMEFMAVELGVWLSGNVAVPIGMSSPEDRVNTIQSNCESKILVDHQLINQIRCLDPTGMPQPEVPDRNDDALLFYTSGSTGVPKGILHTFDPLDHKLSMGYNPIQASSEQVFGNIAPFYFVAIMMTYMMLSEGATVHLYSNRVKKDPKALANYIAANKITISYIAPAVLLSFHNTSSTLKSVFTAGEKLTSQHSQEGYTLYNVYGMSEACGGVAVFKVSTQAMEHVPIGRCYAGIECCIMKEDGTYANVGEEGELCLKGHFCKGYFKDPERTAKLYEGGWLHTGDNAVIGTDGLLYYRNRKDWMVKVNGQRVEPGEVEAALCKMPGVRQAVVKGFDNGGGSQYLCAFYAADTDISLQQFYAHLSGLMPTYMHPTVYVRKDSFVTNANGKIDRQSLIPPKRGYDKEQIVLPCSKKEMYLYDIAREILGRDDFGVTDSLMEMGLDSLGAVQMMQKAGDKHILLKANDILQYQTIRNIAHAQMSLAYWFRPYETGKKIVVFSCGIIGTTELYDRINAIAQHYNVIVVEPFFEHYAYILDGQERFDDLVGLYYDLLSYKIEDPSQILGFIGFSFGGSLAYRLSQMYAEETGLTYKVVCGDAPLKFPTYVADTPEQREAAVNAIMAEDPVPNPINAKIVYEAGRAVHRLMSDVVLEPTNNEVLLFRCTTEEYGNLLTQYTNNVSQLSVVEVDDNHLDFSVDFQGKWTVFTIAHILAFFNGS